MSNKINSESKNEILSGAQAFGGHDGSGTFEDETADIAEAQEIAAEDLEEEIG